MPLSTDTTFNSGYLRSTGDVIRSAHCTPFFMNSATAVYACAPSMPLTAYRSGVESSSVSPPLPMW